MKSSLNLRAGVLSLVIFLGILAVWHTATRPVETVAVSAQDAEYAKLMGKNVGSGKTTGFPTLAQMGETVWKHVSNPFYDNGPNDKGIGIQLAWSLGRVGLGFLIAALIAIPLGFLIGMSPLLSRALNPFIQVLKPISPLAWMPIALYTIKDSSISGVFVIFICSVWPMLLNTAFGVAGVGKPSAFFAPLPMSFAYSSFAPCTSTFGNVARCHTPTSTQKSSSEIAAAIRGSNFLGMGCSLA